MRELTHTAAPPAPALDAGQAAPAPAQLSRASIALSPSPKAGRRSRRAAWIGLLGALCLVQTLLHTGEHSGFYQSSRPIHGQNEFAHADGYAIWLDGTPVLADSIWFVGLVQIFLGLRGPEASGILDRRAAYAWNVSLLVPALGYYPAFVAVNFSFWWAAAAAMWWLARRRTGDSRQAAVAALLVAAGPGFTFAVGTPMSYVPGFALMVLLLALAERLRIFESDGSLSSWTVLGWATGVAGLYYFAHIPFLLFLWAFGVLRVRVRKLAFCTAVALLLTLGWELYGRHLLGLVFTTDNSSALGESVSLWHFHARQGWSHLVETFRIAPVRGTLTGAFAYPVLALAVGGLMGLARRDADWYLGILVAGLVPAIVISALIPLPRTAYYMFPAIYLLAARAAVGGGAAIGRFAERVGAQRAARAIPTAAGAVLVILQLALANADLAGIHAFNVAFHFSMRYSW